MNIGEVELELYGVGAKQMEYVSKDGEFRFVVSREKKHGFPVRGTLPIRITLKVWIDGAEAPAISKVEAQS